MRRQQICRLSPWAEGSLFRPRGVYAGIPPEFHRPRAIRGTSEDNLKIFSVNPHGFRYLQQNRTLLRKLQQVFDFIDFYSICRSLVVAGMRPAFKRETEGTEKMETTQTVTPIKVDPKVVGLFRDVLADNARIGRRLDALGSEQVRFASAAARSAARCLEQRRGGKQKRASVAGCTAVDLLKAQIDVINAETNHSSGVAAKKRQKIAESLPVQEREAVMALAGRLESLDRELR